MTSPQNLAVSGYTLRKHQKKKNQPIKSTNFRSPLNTARMYASLQIKMPVSNMSTQNSPRSPVIPPKKLLEKNRIYSPMRKHPGRPAPGCGRQYCQVVNGVGGFITG